MWKICLFFQFHDFANKYFLNCTTNILGFNQSFYSSAHYSRCRFQHNVNYPWQGSSFEKMKRFDKHHLVLDCSGDCWGHQTPGYSVPLLPTPLRPRSTFKHSCARPASRYSIPSFQLLLRWKGFSQNLLCLKLYRKIISSVINGCSGQLFAPRPNVFKRADWRWPLLPNVYKATRPICITPPRPLRTHARILQILDRVMIVFFVFHFFSLDPLPITLFYLSVWNTEPLVARGVWPEYNNVYSKQLCPWLVF